MWIELTTQTDDKTLVNTEHIISMEPIFSAVQGSGGQKMQIGTALMLPSAMIFTVKDKLAEIKAMMFDDSER